MSPFVIIYGANGAGKSNFVDALRLLAAIGSGLSIRDAIEGHYAASFGSVPTEIASGIRGGSETITHQNIKSSVFEIDMEVQIGSANVEYRIAIDAREYRVTEEVLSASRHPGQYIYSTNPDSVPLSQIPDSPTIVARYYTNSPGRNPTRSFSPYQPILSQFKGRKAEYVYNETWADQLRGELATIQPLELRPEVLRQYSTLGRFTLGEHGENLAAVAWLLAERAYGHDSNDQGREESSDEKDAYERLTAVRSWLSELTPRAVAEISVEQAPTGEAILALKEEPFQRAFTARSLSDGTLRFAALALALVGSSDPRIYVIEELENGINTTRLALLLRMITAATSGQSGKQVITTTHSPTLLDVVSKGILKNVLFIGWYLEDKCSIVRRLSDLTPDDVANEGRLGDLPTEGYLQCA